MTSSYCSPYFLLFSALFFISLSSPASSDSNPNKSTVPVSRAMLNCFSASPGRALSNATPSQEFFNVSPEECLRFCSAERICNTVAYHKHFATCQLYGGAEEGEGAQEVEAPGHDLYMKKECEEGKDDEEEGKKKDEKKDEEEEGKKKEGKEEKKNS